jgi:hypothetical protein
MSTPTIGIGKITIPYTVSGLTHEVSMYVDAPTLTGGTYLINKRPSIGGTSNWVSAAEDFAKAISYVLPAATTWGNAVLSEYFSTGWVPVASTVVTMPNLTGSPALAGQLTMTLRAADFTRPKIVIMEGNSAPPFKTTSATGGTPAQDSFVAEFQSGGALSFLPWVFMTTMHGQFLLTNPFISFTATFNRKMRRARGFA